MKLLNISYEDAFTWCDMLFTFISISKYIICCDFFQIMQSNMKMADAMATTTKVSKCECVAWTLMFHDSLKNTFLNMISFVNIVN